MYLRFSMNKSMKLFFCYSCVFLFWRVFNSPVGERLHLNEEVEGSNCCGDTSMYLVSKLRKFEPYLSLCVVKKIYSSWKSYSVPKRGELSLPKPFPLMKPVSSSQDV